MFDLVVNKNGHRYTNCSYPELIVKAERLWMIVHKKPCVLASRIITIGMARGIAYEMKKKQLNWVTYTKWTNMKQFLHAKAKDFVGEDGGF